MSDGSKRSEIVIHTRLDRQINTKFQAAGFMIKTESKFISSQVPTCASSSLKPPSPVLFIKNKKLLRSDISEKNSGESVFYHNQNIYHINFRELKIAVGDYRNISYLNQDF